MNQTSTYIHFILKLSFLLSLTALVACDEPCKVGSPCDTACEIGSVPICVTESICSCVAETSAGTTMGGGTESTGNTMSGGETAGTEPPPVCEPLLLGDLVINEVMINPSEAEPAYEYVELVNVSNKEIDLTGVNLTYNDEEKFRFFQGCMAPKSSVAAYSGGNGSDLVTWSWSTMPRGIGVYNYRYQFVNSRDFSFNLFSQEGQLLSQFYGESSLIKDGESITRSPELIGDPTKHSDASTNGSKQSPTSCSNGGRFELDCTDGSAPMAGDSMTGGTEVTGGTDMSGEMSGGQVIPPNCNSPLVGDLIINEVMVDAAGDEKLGEFIEILNQSNFPINLDGIQLLYQDSSGALDPKISFIPGCMAPYSAVVIYNNTNNIPWLWSTPTVDSTALASGHSTFALANSRDVVLELRASSGQRLSFLTVTHSDLAEGVSSNRSPDAVESDIIAQHNTMSDVAQSPGVRPDGTRYEDR